MSRLVVESQPISCYSYLSDRFYAARFLRREYSVNTLNIG